MDVETKIVVEELKSLRADIAKLREETHEIRIEFYKALLVQTNRICMFGYALLLINQVMNRYCAPPCFPFSMDSSLRGNDFFMLTSFFCVVIRPNSPHAKRGLIRAPALHQLLTLPGASAGTGSRRGYSASR
jgi:hypothetical protein